MINIFLYNSNDFIKGIEIKGHSNADEHGKDIVCAAISTLAQSLVVGVVEVLKINANYKIKSGYFHLYFYKKKENSLSKDLVDIDEDLDILEFTGQKEKINILLDTFILSVKGIQESYPEYIKIHERRWKDD